MVCSPMPVKRTVTTPNSPTTPERVPVPLGRLGFRATPAPCPILMPKQRLAVWTPMRIAHALMLMARRSAADLVNSARRVRL